MRRITPDRTILVPDSADLHTIYGLVLSSGPDTHYTPGTCVLFLPGNIIAGFNESEDDECFIIPQESVFATIANPDAAPAN